MTHTYTKPTSNQRSTTSRVASAAGRLRPNEEIGKLGTGPKAAGIEPNTAETLLLMQFQRDRSFRTGHTTGGAQRFSSLLAE